MARARTIAPPEPRPCLACASPNTRRAVRLVDHGVPHGARGHGVVHSTMVFDRCVTCAAGQIESLEHNCFEEPDRKERRNWYALGPEDASALERFVLRHCPAPLDAACPCPLHSHLPREVRRLPVAPWPARPGTKHAPFGHEHRARLELGEWRLRLIRDCQEEHPGDVVDPA